jgi:hypothetical protein
MKIMEQSSVQKESPIDFLMTQLYKKGFLKEVDGNKPINLMNQAKEMEKEQKRIKLPSDEEIKDYANNHIESISFVNGAKWMRDKIQGGIK